MIQLFLTLIMTMTFHYGCHADFSGNRAKTQFSSGSGGNSENAEPVDGQKAGSPIGETTKSNGDSPPTDWPPSEGNQLNSIDQVVDLESKSPGESDDQTDQTDQISGVNDEIASANESNNCSEQVVVWGEYKNCTGIAPISDDKNIVRVMHSGAGEAKFTCVEGAYTFVEGMCNDAVAQVDLENACKPQNVTWTANGNTCEALVNRVPVGKTVTVNKGDGSTAKFFCSASAELKISDEMEPSCVGENNMAKVCGKGCVELEQGVKIEFWNDKRPENLNLGSVESLIEEDGSVIIEIVSDVLRRNQVKITKNSLESISVEVMPGKYKNMCYDHTLPKCELMPAGTAPDFAGELPNCSSHIRWTLNGETKEIIGETSCRYVEVYAGLGMLLSKKLAVNAADAKDFCDSFSEYKNRSCKHHVNDGTMVLKDREKGNCVIQGAGGNIHYSGTNSRAGCYWSCIDGKGANAKLGEGILDQEFPNRFDYPGDIDIDKPTRKCRWNTEVLCSHDTSSCTTLSW